MNEWSNEACKGYLIIAMRECGFADNQIKEVLEELDSTFDEITIEMAIKKYDKW